MTNAQKTCSYLCHKQVDIYSMTITQEALSLQKMTFCYLQKYCKNIFATCTEPPKEYKTMFTIESFWCLNFNHNVTTDFDTKGELKTA